MKKNIAILLIFIGVIMIGLSLRSNILPPALTGIGFIAISWLILKKEI